MNSRLVNLVRNWPGWLQVLACHGGWWGASIGMSNAMGKSAHGWTLGARVGVFSHETDPKKIHGSLNVPIEHHPTIRYMVYNGYYKVMSNIPKMGQLPTPKKSLSQLMFLLEMWINGINCNARINGTHSFSFFLGDMVHGMDLLRWRLLFKHGLLIFFRILEKNDCYRWCKNW